jgi:hypothetical protein
MREVLKNSLQNVSPRLHRFVQRRWGNGGAPYRILQTLNRQGCADTVAAGPFAGMRYIQQALCSSLYPKLLGVYEQELHPIINRILKQNYSMIVDVGSAEGYYAVGLARARPDWSVVAFDSDLIARELVAELAALNHCADRIVILGRCDPTSLASVLKPGALIICDCEGYEAELLKPDCVQALRTCDILVELHDVFIPGISKLLLPRFAQSHSLSIVPAVPRAAGSNALLFSLKTADQLVALDEARPGPMTWAWLQALDKLPENTVA